MLQANMAPKKSKESQESLTTHLQLSRVIFRIISHMICNFYLLVVRYTGKAMHTILQVLFETIRDVIKIILMLVARVFSDICYGAAHIVEKIIEAVLYIVLQLILIAASLINRTVRGFVDQAGYSISSAVFIVLTVLIWWVVLPALVNFGHAVLQSINEFVTQLL